MSHKQYSMIIPEIKGKHAYFNNKKKDGAG